MTLSLKIDGSFSAGHSKVGIVRDSQKLDLTKPKYQNCWRDAPELLRFFVYQRYPKVWWHMDTCVAHLSKQQLIGFYVFWLAAFSHNFLYWQWFCECFPISLFKYKSSCTKQHFGEEDKILLERRSAPPMLLTQNIYIEQNNSNIDHFWLYRWSFFPK